MRVEVAIEHLVHDGSRVACGTVLDLPREQAEALVSLGAVRPLAEEAAAAEAEPARKRAKKTE